MEPLKRWERQPLAVCEVPTMMAQSAAAASVYSVATPVPLWRRSRCRRWRLCRLPVSRSSLWWPRLPPRIPAAGTAALGPAGDHCGEQRSHKWRVQHVVSGAPFRLPSTQRRQTAERTATKAR